MTNMHVLKQFDRAQLFRFFVDGRFQKKSKYAGWIGYEAREKGSVQAMLNGFAHMLDNFQHSHRINCAYLRALHRICMLHVETGNDKSAPGDIRYQETGLPFFIKTTTESSLAEIIEMRRGDGTVVFHDRELRRQAHELTAAEVYETMSKKGKILYRGWYPNLDESTKQSLDSPTSLHAFYQAKHYVQMAMIDKMEAIVDRYHQSMDAAANEDDRLGAIALLVRELEVLHPFTDGNCRVFGCILLNQLLLYHGFLPTILWNPNYDFEKSLEEFVAEIKLGMRNTRALLNDPHATVCDFSIDELDASDRERFVDMAKCVLEKLDNYRELFLTPNRVAEYTDGRWLNADPNVRYSGIGTHGDFHAGDLYFAVDLPQWKESGRDVAAELSKRVNAGICGLVLDDIQYAKGLKLPVLLVEDTAAAFKQAAFRTRQEANPKTVLITGTEGKTGSKIQLYHVLKGQTGVHAWLTSANTGVPIFKSLASLDVADRVELNEVSVDADTEKTAERSAIVNPDICFFSNISAEHMHVHGSMANVVRNKSFVVAGMRENGKCVCNSGMPTYPALLDEIRQRRSGAEILTFGVLESDPARLLESAFDKDRIGWHVSASILGEEVRYFLPLLQSHAPLMSVGVLLVVKLLGFDLQRAAADYLKMTPYESMGQIYKIAIDDGQFLFYDQSRRASISGVRSVFRDVERLDVPGKVVALYGSISSTKDNEWTQGYHQELAQLINESRIARLYTSGPNMEVVRERLVHPEIFVKHSDDHDQLYRDLMADLRPGDLLLIQGYLRLNLADIAKKVVEFKNDLPRDRYAIDDALDALTLEQAQSVYRYLRAGEAEGSAGAQVAASVPEALAATFSSGIVSFLAFRARLLHRFFTQLDRLIPTHLGLRCINEEVVRSGFKVLVHNDDFCQQWFNNLDKLPDLPRKMLFGSFFDFGDPKYVFEVMVGTTNLHVGIVKYVREAGRIRMIPMDDGDFAAIHERLNGSLGATPLVRRNWGHKWMTIDAGNLIELDDPVMFAAMFDVAGSDLYRRYMQPLLTELSKQMRGVDR